MLNMNLAVYGFQAVATWFIHLCQICWSFPTLSRHIHWNMYTWIFQICELSAFLVGFLGEKAQILHTWLGRSRYLSIITIYLSLANDLKLRQLFRRSFRFFEPEELTPKIKSPTLIIHGLQDALVSPESWLRKSFWSHHVPTKRYGSFFGTATTRGWYFWWKKILHQLTGSLSHYGRAGCLPCLPLKAVLALDLCSFLRIWATDWYQVHIYIYIYI